MMVSIETFDSSNPVVAQRTRTWRQLGLDSQIIVLEGARTLKQMMGVLPP
jgi:hypothetical protein